VKRRLNGVGVLATVVTRRPRLSMTARSGARYPIQPFPSHQMHTSIRHSAEIIADRSMTASLGLVVLDGPWRSCDRRRDRQHPHLTLVARSCRDKEAPCCQRAGESARTAEQGLTRKRAETAWLTSDKIHERMIEAFAIRLAWAITDTSRRRVVPAKMA